MNIEYLNQKMTLIQAMNGTGLFPKKFILEYKSKIKMEKLQELKDIYIKIMFGSL